MNGVIGGIARKIFDMFAPRKKGLYVHPPIARQFQGPSERVASWTLDSGQWVVIAKAAAQGYGGNDGLADCRLKVVGTEGAHSASDESYGAPAKLLGTTMTVLLPFKVTTSAQFHLQVDVQGANAASFLHIVVVAVRDTTL